MQYRGTHHPSTRHPSLTGAPGAVVNEEVYPNAAACDLAEAYCAAAHRNRDLLMLPENADRLARAGWPTALAAALARRFDALDDRNAVVLLARAHDTTAHLGAPGPPVIDWLALFWRTDTPTLVPTSWIKALRRSTLVHLADEFPERKHLTYMQAMTRAVPDHRLALAAARALLPIAEAGRLHAAGLLVADDLGVLAALRAHPAPD